MSGSMSIAVSGLQAAQAGLFVTGHNMGNAGIEGYARQRALQQDFDSRFLGYRGANILQQGMGADVSALEQIRDKFLDITYRDEVAKASFYTKKAETGDEIENIIGELQSAYNAQTVINDMWEALNELNVHQPGQETRANFIATAEAFVNKANNVYQRLFAYQHNLDAQLREGVTRVNALLTEIDSLNGIIVENEISHDHANDYRDARNRALDALSEYLQIDYKEQPDGRIEIMSEGNYLLTGAIVQKVGLKYTSPDYDLVEPVLTTSSAILPADANPADYTELFSLTDANAGKSGGKLKGLMVAKGYKPAHYASTPDPTNTTLYPLGIQDPQYKKDVFNCTVAFIPNMQKQFDTIVNGICHVINDAVAPQVQSGAASDDPKGTDGSQYTEVFSRKRMSRYTAAGLYQHENDYHSLYTIGNLEINPALLRADGHNKLALSRSGDVEDVRLVQDMLMQWKSAFIQFTNNEPLSIDDAYKQFVNNIGTETAQAKGFVEEQNTLLTQLDNKRLAIMGVSLDEEITNMMKYQHAYNASARVVTVIDSMLDKLINGTGRVGL